MEIEQDLYFVEAMAKSGDQGITRRTCDVKLNGPSQLIPYVKCPFGRNFFSKLFFSVHMHVYTGTEVTSSGHIVEPHLNTTFLKRFN